jgi:transcriptional regulator with XRE-family HTH domain
MNERLKKLRKTLDLTQQEFADRIGIKRNSLANYETGRNTPIDAILISICREWNVNEEWLRTGNGEMFLELNRKDQLVLWASTALSKESEDFRNRFVDALSKLDVNDWDLLANIAEVLVRQKERD